MTYLIWFVWNLSNKKKGLMWLSFFQFLLLFTVIMFSSGMLSDQVQKSNQISQQFGSNTWKVNTALNDPKNLEYPPYNQEQLDVLHHMFGQNVGYYFTKNSNEMYQVVYMSNNLFEKLKIVSGQTDARYFFNDNHRKIPSNFIASGDPYELNNSYKLSEELLTVLFPAFITRENDFIIVPDQKKEAFNFFSLQIFITNVSADERFTQMADQLHRLNPYYYYENLRASKMNERVMEQSISKSFSSAFMSVIAFSIMISGLIGNMLVQTLNNEYKFALLRVLGASKRKIFTLFVLWNCMYILPAFIVSMTAFIIISMNMYAQDHIFQKAGVGVLCLIGIIIIMSIPMALINKKSDSLNTGVE